MNSACVCVFCAGSDRFAFLSIKMRVCTLEKQNRVFNIWMSWLAVIALHYITPFGGDPSPFAQLNLLGSSYYYVFPVQSTLLCAQ